MIAEFERAKTLHALDRPSTVIGILHYTDWEIVSLNYVMFDSFRRFDIADACPSASKRKVVQKWIVSDPVPTSASL
jgi:hypothetical protein